MTRIKLKFTLLLLWMSLIFLLSHEPANQSSERSSFILSLLSIDSTDSDSFATFLVRKSAHIIMFFVLGILVHSLVLCLVSTTPKVITYSILFAFIYACLDEFHQTFIPGRSGEIRDVLIDTIGATLGVMLAHYLYNSRESRRKIK